MALHIYGVVAADAQLPDSLTGLYDEPVTRVDDGDLSALVSAVPEDASAHRAELMSHAQVLERVIEEETVLPMRFGVVLPDESGIRAEFLEPNRDRLRSMLEELDGMVQLTVKAYHKEDDALREVMRRFPQLVSMRDRLASLPKDAAHFKQIEFGEQISASLDQLRGEDAAHIIDALAPLAAATVEEENAALHQVLNAVFLVRRDARAAFDAAVTGLAAEAHDRLHLRFVGPQPPYSFVDLAAGTPSWA